MLSRLMPALLLLALAVLPGAAAAQVPFLFIADASIFEGNAGTRLLTFPVTLTGPSATPVTAQFSATPLSGGGFNPATGGTACTAGVDFVRQDLVPFTIPAGTTTTAINVVICADTAIEPDQHVFVALTSVSGAQCLEGTCNGVGVIRDDDGPPTVSINNISVSESLLGTRTGTFTVSLSHPSTSNTSVNFATRNGTGARGAASCAPFITGGRPDYIARTGTLTIPADTLSGPIAITVCGDNITESDETFFVDLSAPVPAGVTISDSVGQGTIRNAGLLTGAFELSPDGAQVRAGDLLIYTLTWTVPEGEVWRDLRTIDVRIRGGKTALWVRWDEHLDTFSLCRHGHGGGHGGRDRDEPGVSCGAGAAPGSPFVLEGSVADLHLLYSSVVGSGPTGSTVTLELAVVFTEKAEGHSYGVELAATDDIGHRDDFREAATVEVKRRHKR